MFKTTFDRYTIGGLIIGTLLNIFFFPFAYWLLCFSRLSGKIFDAVTSCKYSPVVRNIPFILYISLCFEKKQKKRILTKCYISSINFISSEISYLPARLIVIFYSSTTCIHILQLTVLKYCKCTTHI